MLTQSVPRIFFISAVLAAALLLANFAGAATTALDMALNSSLQESHDLAKSMGHALGEENAKAVAKKQAARPAVEINLDEADPEKAATYKDVQATGNLREERY